VGELPLDKLAPLKGVDPSLLIELTPIVDIYHIGPYAKCTSCKERPDPCQSRPKSVTHQGSSSAGTFSSNEPEPDFHKPDLRTPPVSAVKRSPRSNAGPPTPASTSSTVSSTPWESPSTACSFSTARAWWTTTSLRDVVLPDVKIPLTHLKHSTQSKRLPADPGGSATLDDREWDVSFKLLPLSSRARA
jgi:hypothetical protein